MKNYVWKICRKAEWDTAVASQIYSGSADDVRDGFIHFSAAGQVEETVAKHFSGLDDLILVCVPSDVLGDALKWEASRGGALFPHLYGPLDPTLAEQVLELPIGKDGTHVFPDVLYI